MTYVAYKSAIAGELQRHRPGRTWQDLRSRLKLPYIRPCAEWTRKLESEIGLVREKGKGRALVWRIGHRRS
jgi:hypothetical protein